MTAPSPKTVVLFDGVCGLCDRFMHFLVVRDVVKALRYSALQGGFAQAVLARHDQDPASLDTIVVVLDSGTPEERILVKARAGLYLLRQLGGAWAVLAVLLGIWPTFLLDLGYGFIARIRYKVFGKFDTCPVPPPEVRERFIEI